VSAVLEARASQDYPAWVRRLFLDANISTLLCDYGYGGGSALTHEEMTALVPCEVRPVLRLEYLAEQLITAHDTFETMTAVRDLARPARKLTPWKFRRRSQKLIDSVKARRRVDREDMATTDDAAPITFGSAAGFLLPAIAEDLRDSLACDLHDPEALHKVRLCGKRLRYVLEIFAACLDAAARDRLYGELASMQERLGAINDQHELAERAAQAAGQLQEALHVEATDPPAEQGLLPDLQRLRDAFQGSATEAQDRFLSWWQSDQSNPLRHGLDRLCVDGVQEPDESLVGSTDDKEPPVPEVVIARNATAEVTPAAETDRATS
jgi:hypothetical protein